MALRAVARLRQYMPWHASAAQSCTLSLHHLWWALSQVCLATLPSLAAQANHAVCRVESPAPIHCFFSGESERRLRDAFAAATRDARSGRPVVIFLDEVSAAFRPLLKNLQLHSLMPP